MLTYEQQTEKLLKKRQAVLDRMAKDKAEIDRLNAQLDSIQLAKIRQALGCNEQELFNIIKNQPEQLMKLKQDSVVRDTDTALDDAETLGQTSLFEKKNPYADLNISDNKTMTAL